VVHDLMKKVRHEKDYLRKLLEQEEEKEEVKSTVIDNAI
jgi:hypothetical protein